MTEAAAGDQSNRRLRGLERLGIVGLFVCVAVMVMWSGTEAVAGPRGFLASLSEQPGHMLVAVVVSAASSIVPATPLGKNRLVRVGALVALLASVGWLAFTIGLVAIYGLVMDNFD